MNVLYDLMKQLPNSFQPCFRNRLNNLFLFLQQEKKELSEEEAAKYFLNSTKRNKYFNELKNELKKNLIKYITAISTKTPSKSRRLYINCYQDFTSYKIQLMGAQRKAAIEVAKNLLPKLKKLEIHALILQVAHDLLFHYSAIEGESRLMRKYEAIIVEQTKIIEAESMIRIYRNRVAYICNTRESYTKTIIKEIKEAAEKTTPFLRLGSTYLNRFIYDIIVSSYAVEYDNKNIIKCCNEALNSFPKDHTNIRSLRLAFLHKKALPLAALGELEEAKKIIRETCHLALVGSFNWHLAFIKRIMICFHAQDYQEAYILYKAHRQQKRPDKNAEAYWKILYGYLYFMIRAGFIEAYGEERFNLPKFLNDVPVLSQDKSGNNISILIIEVLVRMQRGQFGRIIDRMDAIREYTRRYTRRPETKRANIFLNMIIKMEAAHFHRSRTEAKTKKLYEKLKTTPLRDGQNMAIEIIPYPVLWAEILELLRDQPRATTVRKTQTK